MKSFASKVKDEISCTEIKNLNDACSELLGMMIFAGKFKGNEFFLAYENKKISEKFENLLSFVYPDLKYEKVKVKSSEKTLFKIKADSNERLSEILKSPREENLPKNLNFFLSGAFLSCGSISNPEVNYHLEFHLQSEKLCEIILSILNSFKNIKFSPKMIKRRTGYAIYIKENEKIEDFLALVGASNCAMQFMQVKMIKEVRNNINRTTNFETANLSKITSSSSEHIKAIKKIISRKKFENLPPSIKETADLRLNNPYISLNELASLHEKNVSKSGVNHRLKKLMEIADKL